MNLEQLKIDSFSSQIDNEEITNIKGGTTPACVVAVGAALLLGGCTSGSNNVTIRQIRTNTCTGQVVSDTTFVMPQN